MGSESTAEQTSVFNAQNPQSTLLSVNMSSVTKLTNENYLMWGGQVRALLEGHELQHFIDSTDQIPPMTILNEGVEVPNPAYAPWRRQDRLLYSALIGAISLNVQSVVSSATTSKEVWDILATTYGNPTRGHLRQLRIQIRTCSKGTKTISEYLRIIKAKSDELALLGSPMDQEDLTEQILAGLSDDYKPEIDAVNARDRPISFPELHERLLNREAMILSTQSATPTPIVANATDTLSLDHSNTTAINTTVQATITIASNNDSQSHTWGAVKLVEYRDIVLATVQSFKSSKGVLLHHSGPLQLVHNPSGMLHQHNRTGSHVQIQQ